MLDTLVSLDQQLLLFLNSFHNDSIDPIINFLSRNRLIWIPLYLGIIFFMIRQFGWKRGLIFVAGAALSVWMADYVCASIIRPEVQRLRPSNLDNPISSMVRIYRDYRSTKFSFPSCHGANCFALAVFTSLTFRRKAVTLSILTWALFMCYTRVYLGVHYPGDLLVGAAIGASLATICYYAARAINRKWVGVSCATVMLAFPGMTCAQNPDAPKFEWSINFKSVFDNREGDGKYAAAQTFFMTQLSPEIGVSFSGKHLLSAGVDYTQPIGCEWDGHKISPTIYYMYSVPKVRFAMGMVPRRHLLRELPNYILSDSASYFQSNIRGVMVGVQRDNGYFQALVDWRGMQQSDRREAFDIIAQGEWQRPQSVFMAGGLVMLNHLARRKNSPEWEKVVDNIIVNANLGFDFTRKVHPLDSLTLRLGPISSITRDRANGKWICPIGLWADLNIGWWRLSLQNTVYVGNKPLFPLYSQFGYLLNDGEPFYAAKLYNRTSVKGRVFNYKDMVSLNASLDFHITDKSFTFYQRLILKVTI